VDEKDEESKIRRLGTRELKKVAKIN